MGTPSAESPSLLGYVLSGDKKDKHISIHQPNMSQSEKQPQP